MKWKLIAVPAFVFTLAPTCPLRGQNTSPRLSHSESPDDDNVFRTLDQSKSNTVRFDPNQDWRAFTQLRIVPSSYEPARPEDGLKPSDAAKVTTKLDASIRSAFKKLPAAEGRALEVRPVVTDVKRTDTVLNLISFALVQMPFSYGAASVRFDLVDGTTGRQIGEIDCKRNARPWNVYPWNALQNFEALGQGSVILQSDAKRLRKDLRQLKQMPARQSEIAIASK